MAPKARDQLSRAPAAAWKADFLPLGCFWSSDFNGHFGAAPSRHTLRPRMRSLHLDCLKCRNMMHRVDKANIDKRRPSIERELRVERGSGSDMSLPSARGFIENRIEM
jgi:hypothetical protein